MLSLDAEGSDFQRESFPKGRDCGGEPDMKLHTWNLWITSKTACSSRSDMVYFQRKKGNYVSNRQKA